MADAVKYRAKCERFPQLVIAPSGGNPIEFKDGIFETEDAGQWETLKQNSGWGSYIVEDTAAAPPPTEPAPPTTGEPSAEATSSEEEPTFPGVRRGSRGTR